MTESRRAELNLEGLWMDSLERNQRQRQTFSSAPPKDDRTRHTSRPGAALSPTSQPLAGHTQKRSYVSVRIKPNETDEEMAHEFLSPLRPVRQEMLKLRSSADPAEGLDSLLARVFSRDVPEEYAHEQINLAEELLRIRWRHDPELITQGRLISLICAIAGCASKSPLLERAQTNLETLVTIKHYPCPAEADLIRLLEAYSIQGNWDRFWETWRLPPRFGVARSENLFANMFEFIAATRNATACMTAVRRCIPEMQFEAPAVLPTDRIYDAAIQCLSIADPDAVPTADLVESGEGSFQSRGVRPGDDFQSSGMNPGDGFNRAQLLFERQRDREFVQIVHDLRYVRKHMEESTKAQNPSGKPSV